eukprot:gene7021-7808_t
MDAISVDKIIFHSEEHSQDCFKRMEEFRSRDQLTDITLIAGDKRIRAHKVVISSLCDYFSAMFTGDLAETQQDVVTLNNIDPCALEGLVRYAYTSELEIRVDNVESLLASSSILQIKNVRDACCDFMKNQLHPSNCLGIRAFADAHSCEQLFKIADKYAQEHFQDVCKNQEFFLLNTEQICEILSGEDLNVTSEEQIFASVCSWINHDFEERKSSIADVLKQVRLPLLTPQFLIDEVACHPAVAGNDVCKDLLMEAMKYHLIPEKRGELKQLKSKPRKGTVGVLYAVGGMDSLKGASLCIEEYNPRSNIWKQVATLTTRRLQFGVAVLDNKLYVTGGRDGLKTLNNLECFDPKTGEWTTLSPMLTHRHGVGVSVLCGPIYAVGGHDGWSYLNTVERYDPKTDQWKFVAPTNTPRSTAGMAVLDNKLYSVGGRDGSSCLSSVEVYDPHTDRWTMAAPMLKRRGGVGVAVLHGYLYALGGHDAACNQDSSKQFSSVERYDPMTDSWSLVAAMSNCRDAVGLSALGDKLYSVGGYDGLRYLSAVEAYDPETNEWASVAYMNTARAASCVVAVKHSS